MAENGNSDQKRQQQSSMLSLLQMNARAYSIVLALFALWIILSALTDGFFLTPRNLSNLIRQASVISYISIGMVLVIVSGGIDLSVGSLAGLTGAVAAMMQVRWLPALADSLGMEWIAFGWPATVLAIAAAIGVGALLGLWQGIWIAYGRVPAFIVTLGGLLVFRGALLGLTRGVNIGPLDSTLQMVGQAYVSPLLGSWIAAAAVVLIVIFMVGSRRQQQKHGFPVRSVLAEVLLTAALCGALVLFVNRMNAFRGIPVPVLLLLLLTVLFTFISRRTQFGRYAFAIGGNIEAARLSGINIRRNLLYIFTVIGALCAVSGIVLTSRLNVATASAGNLFELNAIAACVIGGTSLRGGEGSIPGAIIGSLIMASVDNGMSMMNVESFWQQVVKGLILMVAVLIDVNSKRR